MIVYDIEVTWTGEDGSEEHLPATVCYQKDVFGQPAEDNFVQRPVAFQDAIEANSGDFPDDIEGRMPTMLVIKNVTT